MLIAVARCCLFTKTVHTVRDGYPGRTLQANRGGGQRLRPLHDALRGQKEPHQRHRQPGGHRRGRRGGAARCQVKGFPLPCVPCARRFSAATTAQSGPLRLARMYAPQYCPSGMIQPKHERERKPARKKVNRGTAGHVLWGGGRREKDLLSREAEFWFEDFVSRVRFRAGMAFEGAPETAFRLHPSFPSGSEVSDALDFFFFRCIAVFIVDHGFCFTSAV